MNTRTLILYKSASWNKGLHKSEFTVFRGESHSRTTTHNRGQDFCVLTNIRTHHMQLAVVKDTEGCKVEEG